MKKRYVVQKKTIELKNTKNKSFYRRYLLSRDKNLYSVNFFRLEILKDNKEYHTNKYHQFCYVLSKRSLVKIDNKEFNLKKGDSFYIKPFTKHTCISKGSKILVTQIKFN